jgi:hypothetical protein
MGTSPQHQFSLQVRFPVANSLKAENVAMRDLKQRLFTPARILAVFGIALVLAWMLVPAQAQFNSRRGRRGGGGGRRFGLSVQHQREQEMMKKAIDPAFQEDVFTFARLRFEGEGYGWGRSWDDDTPEADLMATFRLFQTTSLKVRPGRPEINAIDVTTKDLADYPFVYIAAAGRLVLTDDEAGALRAYLLNGGFLMADDFWGDEQWEHFYEQVRQIFPNRKPELMDLTHPIFHTVFDFKKQPQIPSAGSPWLHQSYDNGYDYAQMGPEPHYFGVYDDKRRLMMLICHNNHYGDGWEHEGDDERYFDIYSEPMGYPMLINILAYAMSH